MVLSILCWFHALLHLILLCMTCTFLLQNGTLWDICLMYCGPWDWCIVGYLSNALRDSWVGTITNEVGKIPILRFLPLSTPDIFKMALEEPKIPLLPLYLIIKTHTTVRNDSFWYIYHNRHCFKIVGNQPWTIFVAEISWMVAIWDFQIFNR